MHKSNKTSSHKIENNPSQDEANTYEESSSEQENDQEVNFNQVHVHQVIHSMFMPYIEGPKIDWAVSVGLYHRCLKCILKCKNILECELGMLAGRRKCKTVIAWSGDFGTDQYVSWNLTNVQLTLDVIWENLKSFVNLNLISSELDWTCSKALDKVKDQLMKDTMQYKHKLH